MGLVGIIILATKMLLPPRSFNLLNYVSSSHYLYWSYYPTGLRIDAMFLDGLVISQLYLEHILLILTWVHWRYSCSGS